MSRRTLRNLLVAVDGSETGDYALNVATDIAEKYSAHVDILHVNVTPGGTTVAPVIDPIVGSPVISPPGGSTTSAHEAKQISAKTNSLLSGRRNVVLERNLTANVISETSDDVGGTITRVASAGKYDLVVLGSRGLSGIKSFLAGSVSKKVAKDAKSPVLIVSNRISRTPRILLGYDGSEESKIALDFAADLGKKFGACVDSIGVVNLPISSEGYVISDMDRWEREMKQRIDEAVSSIKAAGVEPSAGKVVNSTDIAKAIVEEAKRNSYDLIVVGSRGYGRLKLLLLGSVATGVANSAKTNVLIVR